MSQVISMHRLGDPRQTAVGDLSGEQEFRRTDFGSRLLAAEGKGGRAQ